MELGFRIPIVSGSSDSLSCIPDSGFQNPGSTVQQAKMAPGFPIPNSIPSLHWASRELAYQSRQFIRLCFALIFSLSAGFSTVAEGDRRETPNPLRLVSVGTNTKHLMNDSQENRLN